MSHLRGVFADQDTVVSTAMRYEFGANGEQTNSYKIAGMGAEMNNDLGANVTRDNTFDPSVM